MGGSCSTNGGGEEGVYFIGGKARGKETIRKAEMLGEVGWGDVDWICLAQDRN
jgi:hypothetical protein